jgi:ankyrin repeat protein
VNVGERNRNAAQKKPDMMASAALLLIETCAYFTPRLPAPLCTSRAPLASAIMAQDAFFVAARENDAESLQRLLGEADFDVNAQSSAAQGSTALHLAASFGSADALDALLAAGADIEVEVKGGARPLHLAAFNNRAYIVQRLLAAGADANAAQEDGSTALLEASAAGHAQIVQLLIEAGADPNRGTAVLPLPSAALKNHSDCVQILLDGGADANAAEADGATALLKAAASGNLRCVEQLLAADANPDTSRDGLSALHYASIGSHGAIVKALLAAGADVTVEDEGGNTPLRYVLAASEPAKIAHTLLQAGAAFEI